MHGRNGLLTALACVLLFLRPTQSFAAHPQLLLDQAELDFIRAKVAKNTQDWRALKSKCDDLAHYAVQWPDAIFGGSSQTRGFIVGSAQSAGVINMGYNGNRLEAAITELGVCYQALKPTSAEAAGKYLEQAHNIIIAISQPPLTLTRQSDGAIRYALSVDSRGNDLQAGSAVSVHMFGHTIAGAIGDANKSVNVGETWTISGATGCSSMNGTWKIASKQGNVISFTALDGGPAPVLNANCTLFSFNPMRDTGYALRFWIPALAKAYDWFYDGLSQSERDRLLFCMNAWIHELALTGMHSAHPENNYAYGNLWAIVSAYVATDGDNSAQQSFFTDLIAQRFMGAHQIRDYRNLWMAGGGFGEGWQAYGYNATRWMMDCVLAMQMHGVDWTKAPYGFRFVDDTLRYWMEFTTPSKLSLDDNEYVFPISSVAKGVTEPVWIPLTHAVMFTGTARRFHSSYAMQFQSWYEEVHAQLHAAAGKGVPEWNAALYPTAPDPVDEVLYYDAAAESTDWKTQPLMYRAWSGNYAVTRSDWTDAAVEVTFLGGATVGSAGNGKTQFNSGSITVQRGNERLLVYGLGEAARSGDIVGTEKASQLHQERATYGNKKNSIFWAGANLSETRNQGLTSHKPPPGQINSVESWGSAIDRAEDTATYTYWRAAGLEANNAKSTIDGKYHQTAWTREVLFIRPNLVVVHDRTTTLNKDDDRAMFWTFGRNIAQAQAPSGMTRYDVSFRGTFRGAMTTILPASPSVAVVDHDDMHFLYRVEVRPAALDHTDDRWLTVLDAADSAKQVTPLVSMDSQNADAVELGNARHAVVAFAQADPPTLPITVSLPVGDEAYIAGLTANANYKVTRSAATLTITPDDGTQRLTSTQAGVLRVPRQ